MDPRAAPRVAVHFANEASLLHLVSALLCEQSGAWINSNIYLNVNPVHPPHD